MTEPLCQKPSAIAQTLADASRALPPRLMRWSTQSRFLGQEEPGLRDIMNDPMTRRLMDSDGVRMDQLQAVISQLQRSLATVHCP